MWRSQLLGQCAVVGCYEKQVLVAKRLGERVGFQRIVVLWAFGVMFAFVWE